jgi:hypothetical protein
MSDEDANIPFIAFGGEQLARQPRIHKGDLVTCPNCCQRHPAECALSDGEETEVLMFVRCGSVSYLCAVAGRLITGIKHD